MIHKIINFDRPILPYVLGGLCLIASIGLIYLTVYFAQDPCFAPPFGILCGSAALVSFIWGIMIIGTKLYLTHKKNSSLPPNNHEQFEEL